LMIVQPATVLRWRRQGLKSIWTSGSRGRCSEKCVETDGRGDRRDGVEIRREGREERRDRSPGIEPRVPGVEVEIGGGRR
jgi:hypothetical protein